MLISELFYSVQGEGLLTGVPSVFIRTSGCNLRCRWCDTPYASWKPEGREMAVEAIVEKLAEWPQARHVVLTGGEPMVAREVRQLMAGIREGGYHLTVETAGTIEVGEAGCDLASLSPKLSNATPLPGEIGEGWIARHEETRRNVAALRSWIAGAGETQIKFVISGEEDLAEAMALVAELGHPVPPDRILLMPEGRSMEELRGRTGWLVEVCKAQGYRFCHRLHIELFGNTRGT